MVKYLIKADGQPEKDHTKDPDKLKELLGGKFKVSDGNFNFGIKFYNGGEVDFKKLAKEVGGEVDSDELEKNVREIMRANFPTITIPTVHIRDKRTTDLEIKKKISNREIMDADHQYNSQVQSQIDRADYNLWIEVNDYREKPIVGKKELVDSVNAAMKKMGGIWLKFMSGIKPDDVIMIRCLSPEGKREQAVDKVRRLIPNPSEIKKYIKDEPDLNSIWVKIDKKFDKLKEENNKVTDGVAAQALSMWTKFKESKSNTSKGVELKDYNAFVAEFEKFYVEEVAKRLSESFLTERSLMESLFGDLYEADADEAPDKDVGGLGFGGDPSDDEEFDDDGSGGGSGGGDGDGEDSEEDGGSDEGDSGGGEGHVKEDNITNIFIIPIAHMDVDISKNTY